MEGLLSFVLFLLSMSTAHAKSTPDVFINQVAITGGSGKSADDFVELYNAEDNCLDISGWQLRKKSSSGSESSIAVLPKETFIAAGDTYVWANSKGAWATMANHTTSSTLAKDNAVALYTGTEKKDGRLVDSVSWGEGEGFDDDAKHFNENPDADEALARNSDQDWKKEFQKPNPRTGITCTPTPKELPPFLTIPVHLSEILANPEGDEHREFIELYNQSADTFDLSGYILKDASKTGRYIFPSDTLIAGGAYLTLTRDIFKFALNNSNETVSLLDPYERELETVSFKKTKEGVSLSFTPDGWLGTTPTPGTTNETPSLPNTKERVPKIGYLDTPVHFTAEPKKKKSKNLKYTWDFGDGHRSYKAETTHTYVRRGTYTVTLVVSDAKNDTVEHFILEIRKFPRYSTSIIRLAPNPKGRDTDVEWLELQNNETKSLDLYGWSIATGTKKPINHPIRNHIKIKAGETLRLTHQDALFSLPNKEAVIELRQPNHKTVQTITYALEKSLPEDALYELTPGGWQWRWPPQAKKSSTRVSDRHFDTRITLNEEEQKLLHQGALNQEAHNTMTGLLTFQVSDHIPDDKKSLLQAPVFSQYPKVSPPPSINQALNYGITWWRLLKQ